MSNEKIVSYIVSEAYSHVVGSVLKELQIMSLTPIVSNEFYLQKHVKGSMSNFSNIDKFIIDFSALEDLDDEIIEALNSLRYLDAELEIIVIAPNRMVGDPLLKQVFEMGIYNIICGSDFKIVKEELERCLTTGKTYKDAVVYKTETSERIVVKTEIKQTVNKVMIGITTSEKRMGGTHSSIQLAATLRKKGYMVAIVELNTYHPVFDILMDSVDEKMLEDHFSIEGIDFYPLGDQALPNALAKTYNFIICDCGAYTQSDQVTFNKCHERLFLSGACAWEMESLNDNIFPHFTEESLKEANYLFLFADDSQRKYIAKSMDYLRTYFIEYNPDMFDPTFGAAEEILREYLGIPKPQKKRRGLFRKGKNK